MAKKTSPLALLVELGDEYGQTRLYAKPVVDSETQDFRNCSADYSSDPGWELAGFTIGAYIDYSGMGGSADEQRGIWGPNFYYEPFRVGSVRFAQAIARTMAKVERSLDAQNRESGYLVDDDFSAYVLRIAKALGITSIYVRNTNRAAEVSGQRWRSVDGAGLQTWVGMAVADVHQGRKSDYVRTR